MTIEEAKEFFRNGRRSSSAMDEPRNVVLTDYGTAGWGVTSGSNPELVGGAETLEELLEEYTDSIVFVQRYIRVGEDLVAIRLRYDDSESKRTERDALAERVSETVGQDMGMLATDRFGDCLVVLALTSDVFGDVTDALDSGQLATVVFRDFDNGLRAVTNVVRSDARDHQTVGAFAVEHKSESRVERMATT